LPELYIIILTSLTVDFYVAPDQKGNRVTWLC